MRHLRQWIRRASSLGPYGRILVLIVFLAFLLRIFGIGYGLPLTVIDDEPPFTLAALKMLELKTLLPILHPESFTHLLYYPPYLAYLYLLPFSIVIGVQYIAWDGAPELFSSFLLQDLSAFFIIARVFSVVLGTASVILIYHIGRSLFKSDRAGISAAFLLATSLLHIGLSMVARHWMPSSFLFLCILFVLSREHMAEERRYFWVLVLAGVGMGISMIMPLSLVLAGLWYLTTGTIPLRDLIRNRTIWYGIAAFIVLSVIPFLLHAKSDGIAPDITVLASKSISQLVATPITAWSLTFFSEPVLLLLAAVGLLLATRTFRAFSITAAGFFVVYVLSLYVVFRFEPRFLIPLIPLYALFGGYALSRMLEYRFGIYIALIIVAFPLCVATRFTSLAALGDTREQVREVAHESFEATDKILFFAHLARLPATKEAVTELRALDESALRRTDEADEVLPHPEAIHALNVSNIESLEILSQLPNHIRSHNYSYAILAPTQIRALSGASPIFLEIIQDAGPIGMWGGLGETMSIAHSDFRDSFTTLFSGASFGPTMVIYNLPKHRTQ